MAVKTWAASFVFLALTLSGCGAESPAPVTRAIATPVVDTDGDGVNDASDLCPNTSAGASVDATGCLLAPPPPDDDSDDAADLPRDADGDGINDVLDQCPNTAMGDAVDLLGCAQAQKDSDADGVNNAVDLCGETPANYAVDGLGCSARHCSETLSSATAQCYSAMSSQVQDCYTGTGAACEPDDTAVISLLNGVEASTASVCASNDSVRSAGFGEVATRSALSARLQESCEGNARQLAARSYGGPHGKVRKTASVSGKSCLDAAYSEADRLIQNLHKSYARCILDKNCDGSGLKAQEASESMSAQIEITTACAASGALLEQELGSTAELFVKRAAQQAHCLIAETHGGTGNVSLNCGPNTTKFAGVRLLAADGTALNTVDDIQRDVPVRVVFDSAVWGTRCGNGGQYDVSLRFPPAGLPIGNVRFSLFGGGVCLTPADCALRPDDLFEASAATAPRSDVTQVQLPYCTQDLHIGGGTVEARAGSAEHPENTSPLYRYGGINVRAAMDFVRDLIWRKLNQDDPQGYRPDRIKGILNGTSAGGFGAHYNYHYPLDELRWVNTLMHPNAAVIVDGGIPAVGAVFIAKNRAWNAPAFLPPYCREDQCVSSKFMLAAHVERLDDAWPYQRILMQSAQHDVVQESSQGFESAAAPMTQWINGVRKLYCDFKNAGTPNLNWYLPANTDTAHGFNSSNPDDPRYVQLLADDVPVNDWLADIFRDPDGGVDRVEEGNMVSNFSGVKSFAELGCTVDGEPPFTGAPGGGLPDAPNTDSQTGCTVAGAPRELADKSCTYVADGPGLYRAATPNPWKITVQRNGQTIVLADGAAAFAPLGATQSRVGILPSVTGETVTVTIVSVGHPVVNGTNGVLTAGELSGTANGESP